MHFKNVLAVALISVSFGAYSQTLMPKIGLTVSSLNAEEFVTQMDNSFTSRTGFTIGLAYSHTLAAFGGSTLALQPEILFVQKGFDVKATGEFEFEGIYRLDSDQSHRINYIDIPVLAKYTFGSESLKYSILAGPAIGFALGGNYTSILTRTQDGITETLADTKGDIIFYRSTKPNQFSLDHNIEFALQAAAGVTLKNKFYLEARASKGLTNMIHDRQTKNTVLQFTIGVPIAL